MSSRGFSCSTSASPHPSPGEERELQRLLQRSGGNSSDFGFFALRFFWDVPLPSLRPLACVLLLLLISFLFCSFLFYFAAERVFLAMRPPGKSANFVACSRFERFLFLFWFCSRFFFLFLFLLIACPLLPLLSHLYLISCCI